MGEREIHEVVLSYTRAEPLSRNAVLKSPSMLTLDLRVRVLTAPYLTAAQGKRQPG